jgi:hypothetical protein
MPGELIYEGTGGHTPFNDLAVQTVRDLLNSLNIFAEFIEKCGKEEDIKETRLS